MSQLYCSHLKEEKDGQEGVGEYPGPCHARMRRFLQDLYFSDLYLSGFVFLRSVPLGICISQISVSRDLYFWGSYFSAGQQTHHVQKRQFPQVLTHSQWFFQLGLKEIYNPKFIQSLLFFCHFLQYLICKLCQYHENRFGSIPHLLGYTLALRCQIHFTDFWTFHKS